MRFGVYIALIVGIGILIGLVAYQGAHDVVGAVAAASWGLIVVVLVRMVPIALDGYVWGFLFKPGHKPPLTKLLWARWIGEAVNTLMPALQVGGAIVRARLMVVNRVPGRIVGASVVVDLTLSTLTQLLFTLVGVALLLERYGNSDIAKGVGAGVGLGLVLVAGMCVFQHRGLFGTLVGLVARIAKGRDWVNTAGGAEALDDAIRALYRRRTALAINASGQLLAWALGAAEIWLALYFMGYPVTIADAILLESLVLAVRSAAFFVPGALGVQEGALMLLSAVVGLSPEVALALSLVKRVRELAIGVPGLMAWQVAEGKQLFARHRAAKEERRVREEAIEVPSSGLSGLASAVESDVARLGRDAIEGPVGRPVLAPAMVRRSRGRTRADIA